MSGCVSAILYANFAFADMPTKLTCLKVKTWCFCLFLAQKSGYFWFYKWHIMESDMDIDIDYIDIVIIE